MSTYKTTILYINSSDATVGENTAFTIYTSNAGVDNVFSYCVQDITVPFTWNTIRDGRDTIVWTDDVDGVLTVTVDPGNYTASELATELSTIMSAASATHTYTVTYDSTTQGFSIVSTGLWSITAANQTASDLWYPIGFTDTYLIAGNTLISVSAINLTGDDRLFVTSATLANSDSYSTSSGNQLNKSSKIASVIIDGNPGSIIQDRKIEYVWREWPSLKINSFDLQLRHQDNSLVDLRGRSWQISILLKSKL